MEGSDTQNVWKDINFRMCGDSVETVSHIVAKCASLAQNQYKSWRHDKVARVIHRDISAKYRTKLV